MHLTGLDRLLWAAGFGGHVILSAVLFLRHRAKQFPIFTGFVLANIARTIVLFCLRTFGTRRAYFLGFWLLALPDTLLQLGVVLEMYSLTFRPLGEWASDLRANLRWLGVITVMVALVLTCLAAPPGKLWPQVILIKGSFFSSICMSELFAGMVALSARAGLPWKTHVARISQGLGFYSLTDLVIDTGHSYFGVGHGIPSYRMLSHLRMIAYLGCVGYWIVMLWRDAPGGRSLPRQMLIQLLGLQRAVDSHLERIRVRK